MKILAIDVSGNWKEGKGTTGVCVLEHGKVKMLEDIRASHYLSAEAYWRSHLVMIINERPDVVVIEGYRLYNHKGMKASQQANSELETPQLIGAIKVLCFSKNIPLHVQYAHEVKSRWSEKVLVAKEYLELKGQLYYYKGKVTNDHKRDALKHALHFWRYGKWEQ